MPIPDPLAHLADARSPLGRTANPMNAGPISVGDSGAVSLEGRAVDVDPIHTHDPGDGFMAQWAEPEAMIEEIEKRAATSHSLSGDVEFMKQIAAHLRAAYGLPKRGGDERPEPEPGPVRQSTR